MKKVRDYLGIFPKWTHGKNSQIIPYIFFEGTPYLCLSFAIDRRKSVNHGLLLFWNRLGSIFYFIHRKIACIALNVVLVFFTSHLPLYSHLQVLSQVQSSCIGCITWAWCTLLYQAHPVNHAHNLNQWFKCIKWIVSFMWAQIYKHVNLHVNVIYAIKVMQSMKERQITRG